MPRIAHIAVKVDELDRVAEFYEKSFGFAGKGKSRSPDRARRRVNDGTVDLTFLRYDDEDSTMAQAAGQKPCIHHFAVEVDDLPKYVAKVRDFGCEILSDPDTAPVKFRIPGGPIMELVPEGRYQPKAGAKKID
jgi:catechol 2,3-dioxygenase-like lactoylglutathione lyase family enzyme